MTDPIRDPDVLINWPVNTPARGEVMLERPLYHNLMKNRDYFARYHAYFGQLLSERRRHTSSRVSTASR